jgi:hypothetical protein
MNNTTGSDYTDTVFAICGNVKGWKVVQGAPMINPVGVQTQADAACPAGLVDVAGGVYSNSSSTLASINSTFPATFAGADWRSYENNASAADETITPWVVCVL